MSTATIESPSNERTHNREVEVRGDVAALHRTLAEFCRSGMPLSIALRSVGGDARSARVRRACTTIATELDEGAPFSDSYADHFAFLPGVYQAIVESGFQSGELANALDDIARDASLRERTRARIRRALDYPLLTAGFVLASGVALLSIVHPITGPVGDAWTPTRSPWLLPVVACALLGLGAGVAVCIGYIRRPLDAGTGPFGLRFKLPFSGRLRSYALKARFLSTLAMLIRRRLPLDRALGLCATLDRRPAFRDQIERMATAATGGAGLADAVRSGDLIPPNLLWFIEAADGRGGCADRLEDLASVYRQRLERATDRITVFAAPALELAVGLVVLALAAVYVLPNFRLISDLLF